MSDACCCYAHGGTACDQSSVSFAISKTQMWVKCFLANEVESDTTDDDAHDCLDPWDTLKWTSYGCDVSLQMGIPVGMPVGAPFRTVRSLAGTTIHWCQLTLGSWIEVKVEGRGGGTHDL